MDTTSRRSAFGALVASLAIVALAVARLPESFIAQLERSRPFSDTQSGWAYRLLVFAALAQAVWVGFRMLQPDRVAADRASDTSNQRLLTIVARTAAFLPALTLVYGLAAFGVTGERGGFWLFVVIAVAQAAWYYRQVGEIGRFLGFQPEPAPGPAPGAWIREPPDYCPPLARGMRPLG